mgnify:CR=1 FL=1
MKVKNFLKNLTAGLAFATFTMANFYQPVLAAELHEVGTDKVIKNYHCNYKNNRIAVTSDGNAHDQDAFDKADMSDVGMVYYMLTNDEDSDYNTLKNYFAEHNFLNADFRTNKNADYKKIYQEVAYRPTRKIKLGTYLENLASLPEKVAVVMGDNKTVKDVPVTWDKSNLKKEPGEYIIIGKLENIVGYQNLANRVAVIKLIVE